MTTMSPMGFANPPTREETRPKPEQQPLFIPAPQKPAEAPREPVPA